MFRLDALRGSPLPVVGAARPHAPGPEPQVGQELQGAAGTSRQLDLMAGGEV